MPVNPYAPVVTSNPYAPRPVPPSVNNPYVNGGAQPPVPTSRPVPPPVVTGPYNPYSPSRPVPPSAGQVFWPFPEPNVPFGYQSEFRLPVAGSPMEIVSNYQMQNMRLQNLYNGSSMSQDQMRQIQMFMVKDAVGQLVNNTGGASYAQRKMVLDTLYNASPMSQEQMRSIDQELVSREVSRITYSGGSFYQKKMELDTLYNASSMNQQQHTAVEHNLIQAEAERIIHDGQPMYNRELELNNLYNATSMTQDEHYRLLDQLHNTF